MRMSELHDFLPRFLSAASERGEEDDGQAKSLHRGQLLHQHRPDQGFWGKAELALMLVSAG